MTHASPAAHPSIAAIFSWDFSRVKNLLTRDDKLDPAEADARIEEYRKYMAINATFNTSHPVSKEVDDVWHAHVLDTVDYARFSERVFGRFLHHLPIFDEDGQKKLVIDYAAKTLPHLKALFGSLSPLWAEARVICMGPADCNGGVVQA